MRPDQRFIADGEWDMVQAYRRDLWRERWRYAGKLAAMLASGALFAWILYGWLK